MKCDDYDRIIEQPSYGDKKRKQALVTLIKEGCVSSLFQHAMRPSRMQWIREYALMALIKFATLKSQQRVIEINKEKITINKELSTKKLRATAARYLFIFVADSTRLTKLRQAALRGLIAGNHKEYCKELLQEPEPWISYLIKKYAKFELDE